MFGWGFGSLAGASRNLAGASGKVAWASGSLAGASRGQAGASIRWAWTSGGRAEPLEAFRGMAGASGDRACGFGRPLF